MGLRLLARKSIFILSLWGLRPAPGNAVNFDIGQLPVGQSLTLPHQAPTSFSADIAARFSATDLPQSLKINTSSRVRVKILDPLSKKVKSVLLRPGLPYLYTFADLGTIAVIPEKGNQVAKIRVESNKPIEVSR